MRWTPSRSSLTWPSWAAAPPERFSPTGWPSGDERWSFWREASTSTRGTSPRTSGCSSDLKRKRYPQAIKKVGELAILNVSEPNEVDAEQIVADVAIVGSGAAGAILAYRLAERGREVVLLEGGKHVDPRDFTEDERVQFRSEAEAIPAGDQEGRRARDPERKRAE